MHQSGLSAEPQPSPGGVEIVSIRSAVGQPAQSSQLGERLAGRTFAAVLTSPLRRAVRTCELAGFGSVTVVEPDLAEWNYWFTIRWLGLEPGAGRYFVLGTASLSEMGYAHDRSEPVIRLWDEMQYQRRAVHARERETA